MLLMKIKEVIIEVEELELEDEDKIRIQAELRTWKELAEFLGKVE